MYLMVVRLMPDMLAAADAFGLSRDTEQHSVNRLHASLQLRRTSALLQDVEDANAEYNSATGLQGEAGNFSGVARRASKQLASLLLRQVEEAVHIGAPQRVIDSLSARSTTTLSVETFFTAMRAHWPNPYSLQYAQQWASAMLLEMGRTGVLPFSVKSVSRQGRGHYHRSGSVAAVARCFQPQRPKPKELPPEKRKRRLCVLRRFAALFKQARQGRVTDKGKERVGTQPAIFYAPSAVPLDLQAGCAR